MSEGLIQGYVLSLEIEATHVALMIINVLC